jgi:ATP:ADP antiporter, AAA family
VTNGRADEPGPTGPSASGIAWIERLVDVRPLEVAAVAWSWLFFFSVLSAYYVIRPIQSEMGVAGGVDNLPWLFAGSLTGMLVLNPPFAWLVARMPRPRFVSLGYRFFALNLVVFFAALTWSPPAANVWIGRVLFVWTSIFNMFVVSIFWSVMADVFSAAQGKRLFGFIGAGGTLGGITGAAITTGLVGLLGAANLLLVSAVLLELAGLAARRLFAQGRLERADRAGHQPEATDTIGGSAWEGMQRALLQPYLVNVTLNMLLFTLLTTFLYFQQATIVDAAIVDRTERTRFFANVDLAVNVLALVTQTFATGRAVKRWGVTAALAFLPVMSVVGFAVLGLAPTIAVLMSFQVLRRAGNFAVARPAREVLFTVVAPTDRYKAKTFIDTVVYRAGDQLGAWAHAALVALGLGIGGISVVAIGLAIVATGNAVWLGRKMQRLSSGAPVGDVTTGTAPVEPASDL